MARERKSTMIELVAELEAMRKPGTITLFLENMIAEAKAGEFHDYKNQKYDCGKVAVCIMLSTLSQLDFHEAIPLMKRVENGEFDEEADEADKAEMRKFTPEPMWDMFQLRAKP